MVAKRWVTNWKASTWANDGKGLVRISDNGKIKEENLLGKLISIPLGDSLSLREFFKRNGFFFDISFDEYEGIDTGKLFEVLTRIRATVELLNQVGELNPERKNYDRILSLVMKRRWICRFHTTIYGNYQSIRKWIKHNYEIM